MPSSPPLRRAVTAALACLAFAIAVFALPASAAAQTAAAPGSIAGRVQHAVTGDYLNNARVSVKGTNLVTLTDASGSYRLNSVPAGAATLRILFSGLDEQEH